MNRTGWIRLRAPALIIAGTLLVLCAVTPARAEPSGAADGDFQPQSSVYFELLGSGVIYSFNYDYRATRHVAVRAGFEAWWNSSDAGGAFPVTLSALIGAPGRGSFEIGGGAAFHVGVPFHQDFDPDVVFSTFVAYRLQPPEGGFFMRVGIGPVWGGGEFIVWPGLSLGYSF